MSDEAKDRALKALLANRDGLMGADLAELAQEYQAPEGVSRKETGLLEEFGPPGELMNEKEIVHAIEELDEDFVLESLEAPKATEELTEPTLQEGLSELEEPQEVHAAAEPRNGEVRGTPKDAGAGTFTEEVEEEDLGDIVFDPEETQYLTVPEEEQTLGEPDQAEPGEGKTGLGDNTEELEETGLISRVDSEQDVSRDETQGVEEIISSRPNDIDLLRQLAAAKEESGELEAALDLYQKILDISPGDEKAEEAYLRLSLKLMDKST
jgi:tetratricopeptide (TPR) repeat protein